MWHFLNSNAGAIQAIAALTTSLVTVVLVFITWRYVRLTRRLAEAASAEMSFHEEAETEKWRELNAYTKLIRGLLSGLPASEQGADRAIRQAPSWESGDVMRLQRLAARLDRHAGERAAIVVTAMTWLAERLHEVKSKDPAEGYDWSTFPWNRWRKEIETARAALDAIAATVTRSLSGRPQTKGSPGPADD